MSEDEATFAGMSEAQFRRFVSEWIKPQLETGARGKLEDDCCRGEPGALYTIPLRDKSKPPLRVLIVVEDGDRVRVWNLFASFLWSSAPPDATGLEHWRPLAESVRRLKREWTPYGVRGFPNGGNPIPFDKLAGNYDQVVARLQKRAGVAASKPRHVPAATP